MRIGLYNLHMHARGGGEKKTLVLADHFSRNHDVWVFVNESPDVKSWERYFRVDLSNVNVVVLDDHTAIGDARRSRFSERQEVLSRLFGHYRRIKSFDLDLFLNNSHCSNLPCPAPRGIYMCMFPYNHPSPAGSGLRRAYRVLMDRMEERVMGCRVADFINSYSDVTAVSEFTAESVDEMWHRRAEVIYSVCENMGPAAAKEKIILHVGRFLAQGAEQLYKRQDVLLSVFRELVDVQRQGWQLHFVGSVARDPESQKLLARLTDTARGLPVFFHLDKDFESLRDLYRRASLYWHATGYGLPEQEHPQFQEHFGMTTAEAMSAGAVPIVLNSGGQTEIVTHGHDGFGWNDLSALASYTTQLTSDEHLLRTMSANAEASSERFGRPAFNQRVDQIIARLVSATAAA
jgi:glycosyltransferase involved in cell wall biosynthesis